MNDIERLKVELAALRTRVQVLEQWIRPIATLEGVDGDLLADQAITGYVCERYGMTLARVAGKDRSREASAVRAAVARQLRTKLGWSASRIGRNLGRSGQGIEKMLR